MVILISCIRCDRTLRVQEHLVGKLIKCPNCQTKFTAQPLVEGAPTATGPDSAPPISAEAAPPSAVLQAQAASAAQALALAKVASQVVSSVTAAPGALASAPIAEPPDAPAVADAPDVLKTEPFETPFFKVLGIISAVVVAAGLLGLGAGSIIGAAVTR